MANKLADALAFQQQRRQALSTADAALADLFGNRVPQPEQPLSTGDYLENLSTGLGRGFESQLEGAYQLARHPIESGKAMYQAGKQVVQNPAMLAEALKSVGQQATSGPLGLGQVAGEYLNPRSLMPRPMMKELDVYHGTPHRFPATEANPLGEFDASKIGTGEGAQAYGHGIYVAQNPAVAKDYQFMEQNWFDTDKAKYGGKTINQHYELAQKDQDKAFRTNNKNLEKDANARLAFWENVMTHVHPEKVVSNALADPNDWPELTNYAKKIDLSKFEGIPESGSFYKADLPDSAINNMLDWDKPLSEQPESVQNAARKLLAAEFDTAKAADSRWGDLGQPYDPMQMKGSDFIGRLTSILGRESANPMSGSKAASDALRSLGIPGIKYLDAGSRDGGSGTRNFVVFPGEEKKVRILERK